MWVPQLACAVHKTLGGKRAETTVAKSGGNGSGFSELRLRGVWEV